LQTCVVIQPFEPNDGVESYKANLNVNNLKVIESLRLRPGHLQLETVGRHRSHQNWIIKATQIKHVSRIQSSSRWRWVQINVPRKMYPIVLSHSSCLVLLSLLVHVMLCIDSLLLYFYSASSSPLLLSGAPRYSIETGSELTLLSATGNSKWRTCPRSLRGGLIGIQPLCLHLHCQLSVVLVHICFSLLFL